MKSRADYVTIVRLSMPVLLIVVGLIFAILSALGILDPMLSDFEIKDYVKGSGIGAGIIIIFIGAWLLTKIEVNRTSDASGKVIIGFKKK